MKKFTESHEWIDVSGDIGIVGITKYAQKELGDIVYVELPRLGATVSAGKEVAVLESTKAAADVYAPVTGVIMEVNQALTTAPELINQAPEQEGWIFKIQISQAKELDELLPQEQCE